MGFLVLKYHADLVGFAILLLGVQFAADIWVRRRMGTGLKWRTHLAFLLLTLAGLAIGVLSGRWERDRLRNAVSSLAPTYADELSRMGHEKISPKTAADDPAYLAMIETEKRWLKTNNTVADIYTFGRDETGQIVLLVDSETDYDHNGVFDGEREERTTIGEVYAEDSAEILRAFAGENIWMDTPTQDRWGIWVSCFVPMRNAQGVVIAVLGVDYPADDWVESILFHRGAALGLAAIAGLIVLAGRLTSVQGRAESGAIEGLADDSIDADGWREIVKRFRSIALVVSVALLATLAAHYIVLEDGMRVARHQFEAEWHDQFQRTQARVEDSFDLTYDALRTIATLPGVRQIDRHARGFDGDARLTAQALYNNLAQHVAVSELYIVPADLDPDQTDPVTGKPMEPITTFDEIIVGKDAVSATQPAKADSEHLEEVEIFEYRAMKQQIIWFKSHAPTRDSFKGPDFPAHISSEVITCDNSEFSRHDLESGNNAPRLGFVYSVPFYDQLGNLKGMISAIVRTQALARLIKSPEFVLQRADPEARISAGSPAPQPLPPTLEIRDALQSHDAASWFLQCDVPQPVYESHPMVVAARARANLTTFTGISVSLPLAGLIWSLLATRRRAMRLANKMTAELRHSEARTKAIIDGALDAVVKCDSDGRIVTWNPQARAIFGWEESQMLLRPLFATLFSASQQSPAQRALLSELVAGAAEFQGRVELIAIDRTDRVFPVEVAIAFMRDGGSLCAFIRDISEIKKAEAEKARLNEQLVDASRRAGMADIATGVLHNVGNVLNSVNVSASVIADKIGAPEIAELAEASQMLRSHQADMAGYLSQDQTGKLVPQYVAALAECVSAQHHELAAEIRRLTTGIDHIKEIVCTQQKFAKGANVAQDIHPAELLETAIGLNSVANTSVEIVRDVRVTGIVRTDKHKLLQVLVNLIANAGQAMDSSPVKRLTLRVLPAEHATLWQVQDTGMGIDSTNLQRIFQHGFTTRKEGHGFGLHSCANAAAEMGGSLTVQSDGPGQGATFTLEIPHRTREEVIS